MNLVVHYIFSILFPTASLPSPLFCHFCAVLDLLVFAFLIISSLELVLLRCLMCLKRSCRHENMDALIHLAVITGPRLPLLFHFLPSFSLISQLAFFHLPPHAPDMFLPQGICIYCPLFEKPALTFSPSHHSRIFSRKLFLDCSMPLLFLKCL